MDKDSNDESLMSIRNQQILFSDPSKLSDIGLKIKSVLEDWWDKASAIGMALLITSISIF